MEPRPAFQLLVRLLLAFAPAGCSLPARPAAVPAPSPSPAAMQIQTLTVPAHQMIDPNAPPVLIAEGRCCAGGVVGSQTQVTVSFNPGFSAAEMRYQDASMCLQEADLVQQPWQPFAPQITLPVTIQTVNWIGLWVSAQFRDEQGRLSPVYCDDISVEGMPAPAP